eukprot:3439565-Rhodomonas_salina.7
MRENFGTQVPYAVVLRYCYAMPGTDIGYAASRTAAQITDAGAGSCIRYAMSGTDIMRAMRCPVLT